jgi:RluA family pseudouridine synthase
MRRITVQGEKPVMLTTWLGEQFPGLAARKLAQALARRDVRVNGMRTGADVLLRPGDEVVLYIEDRFLEPEPNIVYCSDTVIVAVKPAGITSKAEDGADMERLLGGWLRHRGEPDTVLACHRLDNQTGGLLIFARSAAAEAAMRTLMEAGKVIKTYWCIVKGVPQPAHTTLTAYIRKDAQRAVVTVLDRPAPGAKTAVTEYCVERAEGERSLLRVTLHTGRTHQIRAHMAHIGHPILGDDKYGDRQFNRQYRVRRQMLWAGRLEFAFDPASCPALSELSGVVLDRPAPFLAEFTQKEVEK